ncbi:hypothetical protein ATE84_4146 [Aquimarina sp. MAR_2010_214]|nr:hypothetical protein ATE84_4146 [Aquimarina sp. MAR_2010_214]
MNPENEVSQYIIKKNLLKRLPVLMNKMTIIKKTNRINIRHAKSVFYSTNEMASYAPYKKIF